jgi:DNA-binding NtrC family response regulator
MEAPQKTIMFVDDQRSILALYSTALESRGYTVVAIENPLDAVDLFKEDPYRFDLLITDMWMPEMNGDLLVEEMLAIRPDLPIIVYSGFLDGPKSQSLIDVGVKVCLPKPVPNNYMAKTIRDVISASMSSPSIPRHTVPGGKKHVYSQT